ncbi:MAG: alpha/beta hydrolase [Spirochaetaceae bacterium]|nr:MAG: alpha/beta hydrolase [Spirochaetaceae bacterium]
MTRAQKSDARSINERMIVVRGKSIHVRETDASDGARDGAWPTLLCIHGNLGSGRWFEPLLADYPGRAVAPDLPNFAQSDHIDGCSMPDYADWVAAIADELGLGGQGERVVVVGHSLGGAVAMELLCRRPELFERLILVDSSPVDGLQTPKEYYPAIEAYKADKTILGAALKGMVPTLTDDDFFALIVDDAWKMNRDCFIGHAEELGKADYTGRLKGNRVPVHVLRGELDPLITAERAKAAADFFGTTVHTFEGCGHSPLVEQPDRFNALLTELVGSAARGAGSEA